MAKPLISEVLVTANKLKTKDDRVKYLQEQDCTALRDILRINFDDTIELSLPPGEPPFKKLDPEKQKAKDFFQKIILIENSNPDIVLSAQKRLNRDLGD